MKTIIFYDVETTGLPEYSKPSEDPCQPRVTQIAAELCVEETGDPLGSMDMLIRPDGWVIPEELQLMTGITMERANAFGVPIKHALHAFIELWTNADQRCGHNESFDARMIRIELMRHTFFAGEMVGAGDAALPFADYWKAAPIFCTQSGSTKIVNAARPAGEKKKTANLREAYLHFAGKPLEGAHTARADMLAAKAVYYGIKAHNAA